MTTLKTLSEGTILLERYLIQKELGKGGFGRTYLIEDLQQNRQKYVLKEFLHNQNNGELNPKARSLFEQEARILDQLNHEQIPKFLDWFEEDNKIFIVQQYIEGDNYWELLCKREKNNQSFSEEEIIKLLKDLLSVIDYIHSKKIIHRDISPDNIIFCNEIQKPVLIDFGVVKETIKTFMNDNYSGAKGTIIGKLGYSAPEQLKTGECYPNSDIYALGVTALVLLTGKEPSLLFNSYDREKQWYKYVNISQKLKHILYKMLAEYPSERYSSAKEVLQELNKVNVNQTHLKNIKSIVKTIVVKTQKIPQKTSLIPNNNLTEKINFKSKYILLFYLLATLGLGGIILKVKSPYINAICKTFDNCARDKEYEQKYQVIVNDGNKIINAFHQGENIEELNANYNSLNNVITRLKNIPDDVKIYPQTQSKLTEYNQNLEQFKQTIDYEKNAENEFNLIVKNQDELNIKTGKNYTINSYQTIKKEWVNLQERLNNLKKDTFIASQIPTKIIECEEKISYIDNKINSLIAEEKRKQELARIAAQKKANQRNRQASVITKKNPPSPKKKRVNQTNKNIPTSPQASPPPVNVSRKGKYW